MGAFNMDEVGPPQLWCGQHLRLCEGWKWRKAQLCAEGYREASDSDEDADEDDDEYEEVSSSDWDDEYGNKRDCGFSCCPNCFRDHKCGDDLRG